MAEQRALHRLGIRLLDGESIRMAFDPTRGTIRDVSGLRRGFLLTTQRLIFVEGRDRIRSALLRDVQYLQVEHKERSLLTLLLGILMVLVLEILALSYFGVSSGLFVLFVGIPLVLFAYINSGKTIISTHIGGGEPLQVKLSKSALNQAEEFSTAFFTHKAGG